MNKIYIGIDPDTKKSGVAIYDKSKNSVSLLNLDLPELIYKILEFNDKHKEILVVIEKGEENKTIFHPAKNKSVAKKIGVNCGKNFQVTNIIANFMKYHNVNYEFFVPTKSTPKWNHSFAKAIFRLQQNKTNQEQRDALRCIIKYK